MPFGKLKTFFLIFVFKYWLFSGHLYIKSSSVQSTTFVVLWTDTPVSAVELCSSFRVNFGLCAASLINALPARSVSTDGLPFFGRFAVVPCSFHLMMMDLMVLRGIIKDFDIFL